MGIIRKILGEKGESKFSSSMSAGDAVEIIQDYGCVMLNQSPAPFYISDVSKLPHDKEKIKEALLIALSTDGKPQMMDALKIGYLQLANWQEDIGAADLALGVVDNGESEKEKFERVEKSLDEVNKWHAIIEDERTMLQRDLVSIGVWQY